MGCKYLRFNFVSLFQLTSRDSELDSIKDRYNAALKDVCANFGLDLVFCLCWFYRLDLLVVDVVVVFHQYLNLHAPSKEHYICFAFFPKTCGYFHC